MMESTSENRKSFITKLSSSLDIGSLKPWYSLRLFSLYRVFVAVMLSTLLFSGIGFGTLGKLNTDLYTYCSISYLVLSFIWFATARFQVPDYNTQIYLHITTDIVLISLMMLISDGPSSGLGILLIVSVAGATLLSSKFTGLFFAAFTSLLILSEQIYLHLSSNILVGSYPQTGALGAALFGTAALGIVLSRRAQESEALATQRGLDIANLAQLNEHIIQQIQSGVIVIDPHMNVRLINKAARLLLGAHASHTPFPLNAISTELVVRYSLWMENREGKPAKIREPGSPLELQPYFTTLGYEGNAGTLIILEDISSHSRELQGMKLASLGRLTASIAHEIRNPLSAIKHAGQLLEESNSLQTEDQRLTQIIGQQCNRMNTIIENITQLSSRDSVTPETVPLLNWLENFKQDFCFHQNIEPDAIKIDITPVDTVVFIDPSQLHQIVWNLCANSMKYGINKKGQTEISLHGGYDPNTHSTFLDVIDNGSGIPEDIQENIFEPFFSGSNRSTGLGLYIVRELCEFNHAQINYIPSNQGSIFRIKFANKSHFNN